MNDFEKLWRASYPALRRLARSVAIGRDDTEDLLSDTALKAMESFHRFDQESSFHNWVCRIMAHVWLNTLRDRARTVVTLKFGDLDDDTAEALQEAPSDAPLDNVLDDRVERVLGGMNGVDVYLLFAQADGDTAREVAQRFGWAESSARARLCRARRRASYALLN